jgi:hypothetical protein
MSVSNFLFGGNQPTTTSSGGTSSTNLPAWYNDYSQGLIQRANAIASQPYQAYGGARVASPTNLQQGAWAQTPQLAGQFQQNIGGAIQGTQNALNSADPNTVASTAQNAFMNPYQNAMLDYTNQSANRNWQNNIMPQLNNQAIGAGQWGSSRAGRALGNAYGGWQSDLNNQIGNIMGGNWNNALNQANTNLTQRLAGASQLGTQAQQALTGGLQGAAAMNTAGQEQNAYNQKNLDLAQQDFQNQMNYPKSQLGFLQSILQGTQLPTTNTSTSTGAVQLPTQSPLAQIAGAATGIAGLGKLFDIN